MNRDQRMVRVREIVIELGEHIDELDAENLGVLREQLVKEKIDVHAVPASGASFPLDFGQVSDFVIAQFMTLVTPLSVPTELGAARALFEQLVSEAEYVGQRQSGGHLWAIRIADNGRYQLWTDSQGVIERVEYC